MRIVSGDLRRERFEALAPALVEPLRRFLARRTDAATADDVLAETLLVCWRRLDDVPDEALPWAYGVARNCLANAQRGVRRQERLAARIAVVDPPADSTPGPGEGGDADLTEALATLRDDEAELLRLWAWEQLTAERDRDGPGHHSQRGQHPPAPRAGEAEGGAGPTKDRRSGRT